MDLSIIVPCFNEADNIPRLQACLLPVVGQLAKTRSVEVVLVDDGSTDGTAQRLSRLLGTRNGVRIVLERHAVNRGLGAALRTGFAAASGDVVVTTDSDGTYAFEEIGALLSRLASDIDIVTASPYHPQGRVDGVSSYRLILSRGSSAIYRLLVDRKVHTYTSVFRAYRRRVIENVPFASDGFLAGTELLVKSMLLGYRVTEYPTVLRTRASGVSKAKLMRTILAHLRFQARVLLVRLGLNALALAHPMEGRQKWA